MISNLKLMAMSALKSLFQMLQMLHMLQMVTNSLQFSAVIYQDLRSDVVTGY